MKPKRVPCYFRWTALLQSIVFASSLLIPTGNVFASASSFVPIESIQSATSTFKVALPEKFGRVVNSSILEVSNNASFILHIQDAHSNPSAQKSIHDILSWLKSKESGIYPSVIALEGADGPIYPEYFDFFSSYPEINQAIASDLLSKGELTGAEYFAWQLSQDHNSQKPLEFIGVEDGEAYSQNLRTYREILFKHDEIQSILQPLEKQIELTKTRVLSKEVAEFLKERKLRKNGDYGTGKGNPQWGAYLNYLSEKAEDLLQIDLKDPIEQLRYPNLSRVLAAKELGAKVDLKKAKAEKKQLFDLLEKIPQLRAKGEVLNTIFNWSAESLPAKSDDARLISGKFLEAITESGVSIGRYPNYRNLLGQQILSSEIDGSELFDEIANVEKLILKKMTAVEAELGLIDLLDDFEVLQKLLSLELTEDEYRAVLDRIENISPKAIVNRLSKLDKTATTKLTDESASDKFFQEALGFYQSAKDREAAFLANTVNYLSRDQKLAGDLNQKPAAVLVTGGFHTSGIIQELEKQKLDFMVVQPKITSRDEEGHYHRVMRDENADLTRLMKAPDLNKQEALFLKAILETGYEKLRGLGNLSNAEIGQILIRAINEHPVLSQFITARLFTAAEANGNTSESAEQRKNGNAIKNLDFNVQTVIDALIGQASNRFDVLRVNPDAVARAVQPRDIQVRLPGGPSLVLALSEVRRPIEIDLSRIRPDDNRNLAGFILTYHDLKGLDLHGLAISHRKRGEPGYSETIIPSGEAVVTPDFINAHFGKLLIRDLAAVRITPAVTRYDGSAEPPAPRSETRVIDQSNISTVLQLDALTSDQRAALDLLLELNQGHLFSQWDDAGINEDRKQAFLEQVNQLNESYPGGLRGYQANARKLLAASKAQENPLEGYVPSVPTGTEILGIDEAGFSEANYTALQASGIDLAGKLGFIQVAGGVGDRLGFKGIKIEIPLDILTGTPYEGWYAENILAFQNRSNQATGESREIPLAIMTSDDTNSRTAELFKRNDNFGLSENQVTFMKQEAVPAISNNQADFVLDGEDPYKLQTKPHGHGDVHVLMHLLGIAKTWKQAGLKYVAFIQDTNGQVVNGLLPGLAIAAQQGLQLNFLTVPRAPGEAAGAIVELTHASHPSITGNVEYNQLGPLLNAAGLGGDVADPATGNSPYPGNLNVFFLEINTYLEILEATGGAIEEFINPKYADDEREIFKPTRLESMMQDIAKNAILKHVGFINFHDKRLVFSPVKNGLVDGAKKRDAMATGEADFYQTFRKLLAYAGVQVNINGPERTTHGVRYDDGAKIILRPSFALTLEDVKHKVQGGKITDRSALVVDGEGIKLDGLKLDGALSIKALPGANVTLRNVTIVNDGISFVDLTPEELEDPHVPDYLKIRGYKKVELGKLEIIVDQPGDYVLDAVQLNGVTGTFTIQNGVLVPRSETRAAKAPLAVLRETIDSYLALLSNGDKKNALHGIIGLLRRPENEQYRNNIISTIREKRDAESEPGRRNDLDDILNYAQGQRIGFIDVSSSVSGIATLGTSHFIQGIGSKDNLEAWQSLRGQPFYRIDEFEKLGVYEEKERTPQSVNDLVRDNEIIYIDYPIPTDRDSSSYVDQLRGVGLALGDALKVLRDSGDRSPRVFILRSMSSVGMTEELYDVIKYSARSADYDYLNFDVVYQPDLSYRDQEGDLIEPYVAFGLRDALGYPENSARREALEKKLRSIYSTDRLKAAVGTVDIMSVRSAEQAQEALFVYLGTKFALFNDMAELADRYYADLSVIALGAGLDRRIQKLITNPSISFGGRLLDNLRWIREKRISRIVEARFAVGDGTKDRANIRAKVIDELGTAIKEFDAKKLSIGELFTDFPDHNFQVLFWVELLLKINQRNRDDFITRIEHEVKGKYPGKQLTVAIVGVGYSRHTGQLTGSPALRIMNSLQNNGLVEQFIIVDSEAEAALQAHPDFEKLKNKVEFNHDVYQAATAADITIVATNSGAALQDIDLSRLRESLTAGSKQRILFDGINFVGLGADGKVKHRIDDFEGVNYVGVGRPDSGPLYEEEGVPQLADSYLYGVSDFSNASDEPLTIAVIGGGYVGLSTSANFAALGHEVRVVDLDHSKIAGLNTAEVNVPIYEPGLRDLIKEGKEAGRLSFTTRHVDALQGADVVYVAVDTKAQETGEINLNSVIGAITQIGTIIKNSGEKKTIVIKSTVTPDVFKEVDTILRGQGLVPGIDYALVSNPEFLREGTAVEDVTRPDRTVIGIYNNLTRAQRQTVVDQMLQLWKPILKARDDQTFLITDTSSATLIKYLANSYLAVSISFANLFARDTAENRGDFSQIAKILHADHRIGKFAFLSPGCGYGGSCFPKDVLAIYFLADRDTNHPNSIIRLAHEANLFFQGLTADQFIDRLTKWGHSAQALKGKTVAVWGLTFKADSGDFRKTPPAAVVYKLIKAGATLRLHDPVFNIPPPAGPSFDENIRAFLLELHQAYQLNEPNSEMALYSSDEFFGRFTARYIDTGVVTFVLEKFDVFSEGEKGADGLILLTDWKEYDSKELLKHLPTDPQFVLFDTRNLLAYRPDIATNKGSFIYEGTGRSPFVLVRSESRKLFSFSTHENPSSNIRSELRHAIKDSPFVDADTTQLAQKFPALVRDVRLSQQVTEQILRGVFVSDEVPLEAQIRALQIVLLSEAAQQGTSPILQIAKDVLGDAYFNLLFREELPAIQLVHRFDKAPTINELLVLFTVLISNPKNHAKVFVPGISDDDAVSLHRQLVDQAVAKKFPSTLEDQFEIVPSDNAGDVRAIHRFVSASQRVATGYPDNNAARLEKVPHATGLFRISFHLFRLSTVSAPTAAYLREQPPEGSSYLPQQLEAWLNQRGIDTNDFAGKLQQLLKALSHIETQA